MNKWFGPKPTQRQLRPVIPTATQCTAGFSEKRATSGQDPPTGVHSRQSRAVRLPAQKVSRFNRASLRKRLQILFILLIIGGLTIAGYLTSQNQNSGPRIKESAIAPLVVVSTTGITATSESKSTSNTALSVASSLVPTTFVSPAAAAGASPQQPLVLDPSQSQLTNDVIVTDPRFRTCREAKSYGYGPYIIGVDPEYDWYRDADSDGIVCE